MNTTDYAQDTLTLVLIAYSTWSFFWICFNFSKFILLSAERDLLARQLDMCKLDLAISHENALQTTSNSQDKQTIMTTNQHTSETILEPVEETILPPLPQSLLEEIDAEATRWQQANNFIISSDVPTDDIDLAQSIADEINQELAQVMQEMADNCNEYVINRTDYLMTQTIRQLKEMAKNAGIRNYSRWNKAQLVQALA